MRLIPTSIGGLERLDIAFGGCVRRTEIEACGEELRGGDFDAVAGLYGVNV